MPKILNHKFGENINKYLTLIVLILGITLLFRQYFLDRSFWYDEAVRANWIVDRSFSDYWRPYDPPIGFTFSVKLLGILFNYRDLALRFIPILGGIGSVVIAFFLKNRFKHQFPQLVFLCLISLSPILIYYGSELHSYGFDVFCSLAIIWVSLNFQEWKHGNYYLLLTGVLAILFSFTSVIMLASIGIIHWITFLKQKRFKELRNFILIILVWLSLFGAYYLFIQNLGTWPQKVYDWWAMEYAPLHLNTFDDLFWYIGHILGLVKMPFENPAPLGPPPSHEDWVTNTNLLLLTAAIIGSFHLYRHDKKLVLTAILPVCIALLISGLKLYPFSSRLILFLIPCTCLLISGMAEWLMFPSQSWLKWLLGLILLLFLLNLQKPTLDILLHPTDRFNIKAVLEYVHKNKQPNDVVVLSVWSEPVYNFYKSRYDLEEMKIAGVIDTWTQQDDLDYSLRVLCDLPNKGLTWLIFNGGPWKINNTAKLTQSAPMLMYYEELEAGAYLFDLTSLHGCP